MIIGIIGTGQRAWGYIKYINKSTSQIKVKSVWDVDCKRSTFFKNKSMKCYNINMTVSDSFDVMVSDKEIDVIFVCTPDNTHIDIFKKCVVNNKHILLEKPICTTLKQLECLETTQRVTNVFVPFVLRFVPVYKKVKELIPLLGKITLFDMKLFLNYSHSASYYRRWHRLVKNSGGFLLTKCCHDIDVLLWMNGSDYLSCVSMGNKKVWTEKPRGNCRNCDQKDCKFRFDGKYLFRTDCDIEDYGNLDRCIYDNDHDIKDHQTCMFDYGEYNAIFSVTMYNNKSNRELEIRGEHGSLTMDYRTSTVRLYMNGVDEEVFECEIGKTIGHKGSDVIFIDSINDMIVSGDVSDILFREAVQCTKTCMELEKK